MDNRSILGCLVTLVLAITASVVYISEKDDGNMTLCSPFKALIIWSANTSVDKKIDISRLQQKRFVVDFIKATPDGSHISVIFVGNKKSEFKFKKTPADISYLHNITSLFSKTSMNNEVNYKTVSDAMFHFFDRNESPKLSEQVFFIANENTNINDIAKVQEATKKKKRYVVMYGKHYGDVWTSLALDKEHLQVLGENNNDIKLAVNSVKKQSCKDSQHVCDVDQYMTEETEKRCYRCSYICSKFKNMDSEYCSSECPYFKRHELHNDNLLKDDSWSDKISLSIFNTTVIALIIIFIREVIWAQWQNLRDWWRRNVMKHFQGRSPIPQLQTLSTGKISLLEIWEERRILDEHFMDLFLFIKDTEQAVAWMTKQEDFLANEDLGDSLDSVEALFKKHDDFKKSLEAQEGKIKALDEFATKLIDNVHYAADNVAAGRDQLLTKRNHLYEASQLRRHLLEESYKFQTFQRDCDEIKSWINEKLKTASDENYLDPTNLQTKVQKHLNFEAEIEANKNRIDTIQTSGEQLLAEHYASDTIRERTVEILELWNYLQRQTSFKGNKLKEASQQQQFNRNVEDIEAWLSEIGGQLMSEDYGKDLTSVQNLQKKHALLEADVAAHQDRIEGIAVQAQSFVDSGHFDSDNIKAKQIQLLNRYKALKEPMAARHQKLEDALRLQELLRIVEDVEDWIRKKEPLAASIKGDISGKEQNLMKKHQALQAELAGHQLRINNVSQQGGEMIKHGHFAGDEIKGKISNLEDRWQALKHGMETGIIAEEQSFSEKLIGQEVAYLKPPHKSSSLTPLMPREYAQETEQTAIADSNLGQETAEQSQPMERENTAIANSNSGQETAKQIQPMICYNKQDNAAEDYPDEDSNTTSFLDKPNLHEPQKK